MFIVNFLKSSNTSPIINNDLAKTLSKSANPSVDTLNLVEQLKQNPEQFVDRYLNQEWRRQRTDKNR